MNAALPPSTPAGLASVDSVTALLERVGYIASRPIATALYLAHHLRKPVLIEGPAGVGKTELAVSAARALQFELLRLQCYEGLDDSKALYEWKYGKQLLYTQILKEKIGLLVDDADTLSSAFGKLAGFQDLFFSRDFLEPRPLLQAMEQPGGSVLLIDEIDKSEESFEALLLEVLADYQVTIPEIGTIRAEVPPLVILTSNNTRELGDALKRRCLHLHIGFPDAALEQRVLRARVPGIQDQLLAQLVAFVQALRADNIRKPPSIAESVDWARTLMLLHASVLDEQTVRDTLGVLLKRETDVREVEGRIAKMTQAALAAG
ncbi:MoxR family ATPase [Pseudorhodoferax sp. Leaf265]|uniref:AAA family ATPase n=1 Tax=Pseudorhodoferax sp. Leaf265 TaxID=1736315 RepID=UPI0006F799ED|nr:MoxR family ATPase [Pseudorhodoferax sp. Leaf265]KQP02986.1 ATPase [Pseudorhodoferax sp. Leaf265]